MTPKAEVIYFPKPCPHCKEPLFRSQHMSYEWSECRNKACPFLVNQVPEKEFLRGVNVTPDPTEYRECFNRR